MKNIAVIAHDKMKPLMVKFLIERKDWIPDVSFMATGRTAEFMEKEGLKVIHLSPGKYGGYRQIIDKINSKEVDIVIFFRDVNVIDHHEDIASLMTACIGNDIPYAVNFSSAELVILGLLRKETSEKFLRMQQNQG